MRKPINIIRWFKKRGIFATVIVVIIAFILFMIGIYLWRNNGWKKFHIQKIECSFDKPSNIVESKTKLIHSILNEQQNSYNNQLKNLKQLLILLDQRGESLDIYNHDILSETKSVKPDMQEINSKFEPQQEKLELFLKPLSLDMSKKIGKHADKATTKEENDIKEIVQNLSNKILQLNNKFENSIQSVLNNIQCIKVDMQDLTNKLHSLINSNIDKQFHYMTNNDVRNTTDDIRKIKKKSWFNAKA